MHKNLFEIASRVRTPITIAAIVVLILYLTYRAILSLNVFPTLEETSSYLLIHSIANAVFYLGLVALAAGTTSYLYTQYVNTQVKRLGKKLCVTGNVILESGTPVKGATVFVEGVDRQKETDSTGWFEIEVNEQELWTVRASYEGVTVRGTVERRDIQNPVRLELPDTLADERSAGSVPLPSSQSESEELRDRNAYIERYISLINLASSDIVVSTSKLHRSTELAEAKQVNEALQAARQRNVNVRVIVAADYDRIPGAIELQRSCGIAVRFDPDIHFSDINYACIDSQHVIVATRQISQSSSRYSRSTSWVAFHSYSLASALLTDFDNRWSAITARTMGQYLRATLPRVVESYGIDLVARQLHLSAEIVERYRSVKPFVLCIVGRPGSGKTTIACQLQKAIASAGVFHSTLHLSDLEYIRKAFESGQGVGTRFEETPDGGFYINDQSIYDEALEQLAEQVSGMKLSNDLVIIEFARQSYADALGILARKGLEVDLVVYLDVDLETAMERNRARAGLSKGDNHYVSEREMRETYATDDIMELMSHSGSKVIIIEDTPSNAALARDKVFTIAERVRKGIV